MLLDSHIVHAALNDINLFVAEFYGMIDLGVILHLHLGLLLLLLFLLLRKQVLLLRAVVVVLLI
jgi:hypothetical protein